MDRQQFCWRQIFVILNVPPYKSKRPINVCPFACRKPPNSISFVYSVLQFCSYYICLHLQSPRMVYSLVREGKKWSRQSLFLFFYKLPMFSKCLFLLLVLREHGIKLRTITTKDFNVGINDQFARRFEETHSPKAFFFTFFCRWVWRVERHCDMSVQRRLPHSTARENITALITLGSGLLRSEISESPTITIIL